MTLIRPVWVALVLAFSFLVGCASTPDTISSGAAHQIDPIRHGNSTSTGWLVAHVDGSPRDIEYFINGVHLEPEEPIEWWKDAAIRVQLRPGLYDLEARYLVRAFAGRGIEYRIITRNPVEVRAGVETEVEARLEKDWRGVPAAETAYFVPVTEERRARQAAADARRQQPPTEPQQEDAAPSTAAYAGGTEPMRGDSRNSPQISDATSPSSTGGPASIVIHGNDVVTGAGTVVVQDAQNATPSSGPADDIVVRGDTQLPQSPANTSAPGQQNPVNTSAPAQSSPSAPSLGAPALLGAGAVGAATMPSHAAADPVEPVVLEGAEEFGITVSIESVPSGAVVMVDEQSVGQTPVAVRLDPRADHIIEFAHDGCGDYVRLLSSNSWREGRDTSVKVQLYCD